MPAIRAEQTVPNGIYTYSAARLAVFADLDRADQAQMQEFRLKGGAGGKNYIGPHGDAGGTDDREIVSFDGRVMVLRFVDAEVAGRFGTGVYVRCAPRA